MPTYEKPIWALIEDALPELGDPFSNDDMVTWFREKYPLISHRSIRAHLRALSVNVTGRQSHPNLAERDLLYKLDRALYAKYNPQIHGAFDRLGRQVGLDREGDEEDLELGGQLSALESTEFALEVHLEEFMERNWSQINFGRSLEIWTDHDDLSGRQYHTEVGYIDFLCRDTASDALVVIELKKNKTGDQVIGQCQRYMGWVKRHAAREGQSVEGLIIAPEVDDKLRYALDMTMNISALCYRVQFELAEPEDPRA